MVDRFRETVFGQVLNEQHQAHETRKKFFRILEKSLGRPVISFFTSFRYPAQIEATDADMLEGVLQKLNLSNGLALLISSPGGDGLAAERIINVCRNYSSTDEFWVIVPSKAKSAATMICFGASKILMGLTCELGPIDPQIVLRVKGNFRFFSVYNIVKSYEKLFEKAVKEKGNLEPYLQQLQNYDEREIEEFRTNLQLAEDIAVRNLASGMLNGKSLEQIKKDIEIFLSPEYTKSHGRAIYYDEAKKCGLNVELLDVKSELWKNIYELYIRTNHFVSTQVSKCVESKDHSYAIPIERGD